MKHVLHLWFIFIIQLFLISNETFDQNHHNDDLNLHQTNIITISNVLVKYNENNQFWKVDCEYDNCYCLNSFLLFSLFFEKTQLSTDILSYITHFSFISLFLSANLFVFIFVNNCFVVWKYHLVVFKWMKGKISSFFNISRLLFSAVAENKTIFSLF